MLTGISNACRWDFVPAVFAALLSGENVTGSRSKVTFLASRAVAAAFQVDVL